MNQQRQSRPSRRVQKQSELAKEWIELHWGGELKTPHVVNRVKKIGQRITSAAGLSKRSLSYLLTTERFEWSHAWPPDTVIVTFGRYLACKTDDELAGVLAHEVSLLLAWRENTSVYYPLLDGIQDKPAPRMGWGKGHLKLIHCVSDSNDDTDEAEKLRASRQDEDEADRRAVRLLKDAGYDSTGLATYLWRDLSERCSMGMENLFSDEDSYYPSWTKRITEISQAVQRVNSGRHHSGWL